VLVLKNFQLTNFWILHILELRKPINLSAWVNNFHCNKHLHNKHFIPSHSPGRLTSYIQYSPLYCDTCCVMRSEYSDMLRLYLNILRSPHTRSSVTAAVGSRSSRSLSSFINVRMWVYWLISDHLTSNYCLYVTRKFGCRLNDFLFRNYLATNAFLWKEI
jgi:hypothetical protein